MLSIVIAWRLALVAIFGVSPLISLAGFLQVNLSAKNQSRDIQSYKEVLRSAPECVACVRTLSSLTMGSEVSGRFAVKIKALTYKAYVEDRDNDWPLRVLRSGSRCSMRLIGRSIGRARAWPKGG